MKQTSSDPPIYAALFTEGVFQSWLDRTAGTYLHELIGKGAESKIMDAAVGIGHRLKAGHDVQTLVELFAEDDLAGAETWFRHMLADFMSPDGIPVPGASYLYRFMEETVGVSERVFVDWTCVSATDVLAGGVTLLLLARMHKLATEQQRLRRLGTLTVGQVLLLSFFEANPFFLATLPVQAVLMRHEWRKAQLKRLQERLELSDRLAKEAAALLERVKV